MSSTDVDRYITDEAVRAISRVLIMRGGIDEALRAAIARVRALHAPYPIYDECDHEHTPDDPGVVEVEDIGLTCNKTYDICGECCMYGVLTWRGQSEECVSEHDHGPKTPICATLRALDGEA